MSTLRRLAVIVYLLSVTANDAWACSVCQGDPDSSLTKGAEAGVLLLAIVTYALLLGLGSVVIFWTVRARRLRSQLGAEASRADRAMEKEP